jgi:hypothetical protein
MEETNGQDGMLRIISATHDFVKYANLYCESVSRPGDDHNTPPGMLDMIVLSVAVSGAEKGSFSGGIEKPCLFSHRFFLRPDGSVLDELTSSVEDSPAARNLYLEYLEYMGGKGVVMHNEFEKLWTEHPSKYPL